MCCQDADGASAHGIIRYSRASVCGTEGTAGALVFDCIVEAETGGLLEDEVCGGEAGEGEK